MRGRVRPDLGGQSLVKKKGHGEKEKNTILNMPLGREILKRIKIHGAVLKVVGRQVDNTIPSCHRK